MNFKHDKMFYLKVFLFLVLVYFVLTYSITHKETIGKEIEIITLGTTFFTETTAKTIFPTINKVHEDNTNDKTHEIELIIFKQINDIRIEKGLNKLEWDPMLSKLAREHSMDMARNNYFNHTDLFGNGPKERAKIIGIKTTIVENNKIYFGVGENIGLMPQGVVKNIGVLILPEDIAQAMVLEWMLSEPHKENILTQDYFFTGVGVAYDSNGNYLLTQNFQ